MEYEPFGSLRVARMGDPLVQPLRFPGQEETPDGNYKHLQVVPGSNWGRYTQSDPLGLGAGPKSLSPMLSVTPWD